MFVRPLKKRIGATNCLQQGIFFEHPDNYFSQLKNIRQAVLVAGAKQDIAFPMIDAYLLAREIPDSQLFVYSNAGHAFQHQYYKHFGNLVNAFLNFSDVAKIHIAA